MSEESDKDNEKSKCVCDLLIKSEQNKLSYDMTTNPIDEDNQFIYDEHLNKLICVGSNFDDIPCNIIKKYACKTQILDLSGNHFRLLTCIENFLNLEELILDGNQLNDTQTQFPKLSELQTLMINKNHFQDLYRLADQLHDAYPKLAYLSLLGNDVCPYRIISTDQTSLDSSSYAQHQLDEEYRRYRHLLIYRIPTLKFLDSREINRNERHAAMQLGDILYSLAETKSKQPSSSSKINFEKDIA